MGVSEIECLVKVLEFFEGMVGKEGPFFFDCNVVRLASGDVFTIGEKGKLVTMSDIIETLRRARDDKTVAECHWSGGSFYHEGYSLSRDGRTVKMIWGS